VPVPPVSPRVVVGVGNSKRLLHDAVTYADEINVYSDDEFIQLAQREIVVSQRNVIVSTFTWGWREDLAEKLPVWEAIGVERVFVTIWKPQEQLAQLAKM
jgi:hypothetical protein